jgi:heptosyltransferase-2
MTSEPRHHLVFSPNWLGDAVMALPALADICRAAGTTVDVAASSRIAPLYSLVPGIREVVALAGGSEDVATIRQHRYDVAVLFPNSFRSAWVARQAGISERWGYRSDLRRPLLTRAIAKPDSLHQVEYYQSLVRGLGFPTGPTEPRLEVPPDRRAAGEKVLRARGWDGRAPLVALAPGAAYGGAKRWPSPSFAALIDSLAATGRRAILVGGAADEPAGRDVLAAISGPTRPINLIGRTDLPSLAAVLTHCHALVSNDSGAMHVGAALGVDVTALFGPTNERETGPRGNGHHTVLTSSVWCRPCMLRECPLTHRCMKGISVEAVVQAMSPSR